MGSVLKPLQESGLWSDCGKKKNLIAVFLYVPRHQTGSSTPDSCICIMTQQPSNPLLSPLDSSTAATALSSRAGPGVREDNRVNHTDARLGNKQPKSVLQPLSTSLIWMQRLNSAEFDRAGKGMGTNSLLLQWESAQWQWITQHLYVLKVLKNAKQNLVSALLLGCSEQRQTHS